MSDPAQVDGHSTAVSALVEAEHAQHVAEDAEFDPPRDEALAHETHAAIHELEQELIVAKRKSEKPRCIVTGKEIKKKSAVRIDDLRPTLAEKIRHDHPEAGPDDVISREALSEYRSRYISDLLTNERGALSTLEQDVVESLRTHEILAENVEAELDEHRTLGQRVADIVASFGGSWTFIISFFLFLAIWMSVNVVLGEQQAFDVYPFILVNLVLSCLAAIQAPIIMMSQKRQEEKDRARSENDYRINLKAELEIRHLHEKVDHLLNQQWERLAEIQQIQIEMMHDLAHATIKRKRSAARGRNNQEKRELAAPAG